MRLAGIDGVRRGRRTTITTRRESAAPRHPDLVERAWATPSRPDQWWVADFIYVWTHVGFVYVSFVTDVCSRRTLGWRVSTAKTTPLVMSALEQALFTRRRGNAAFTATGLIHHSDAGAQYTSLASPRRCSDSARLRAGPVAGGRPQIVWSCGLWRGRGRVRLPGRARSSLGPCPLVPLQAPPHLAGSGM
jgi:transposase InsO family protein